MDTLEISINGVVNIPSTPDQIETEEQREFIHENFWKALISFVESYGWEFSGGTQVLPRQESPMESKETKKD